MRIYRETEMKCRFYTKLAPTLYSIVAVLVCILPAVIYSSVCMWYGNFDTSTWFIPMKFAVPFNTATIGGWYVALLVKVVIIWVFIVVITALLTYLLSVCWYVKALRDHFESFFQKIDSKITFDQMHSERNTEEKFFFKELILFHMKMTE